MSSYNSSDDDDDDDQELEFASADEGSESDFEDSKSKNQTSENFDLENKSNLVNETKILSNDQTDQVITGKDNFETENISENVEEKLESSQKNEGNDIDEGVLNLTEKDLEKKIDVGIVNLETKEEINENKAINQNFKEEIPKTKLDESSDLSDFDGDHKDLDSELSDIESNENKENSIQVENVLSDVDNKITPNIDQLSTVFTKSCKVTEIKLEESDKKVEEEKDQINEENDSFCSDSDKICKENTKELVQEVIFKKEDPISCESKCDKEGNLVSEVAVNPIKEDDIKTEESNVKIKNKDETSNLIEETKVIQKPTVAESGWDTAEFSDIDDDNLSDDENLVKDEKLDNKNESIAMKTTTNKPLDNQSNKKNEIKVENKPSLVQKKVIEESVGSGWDNADFSDIDDDEFIDSESVVSNERSVEKNVEKLNKETINKQQPNIDRLSKAPAQQQQQQQNQNQNQKGWGWFGSIINTASNLTSQFVETVEQTLGAPDPVELARKAKLEREIAEVERAEKLLKNHEIKSEIESKNDETSKDKNDFDDTWNDKGGDWFSAIPINKITSTGKQLVSGSLDVLETVGKKTIEVINDKDPNLRQTREFIKTKIVTAPAKPNLSQLLREAQEESLKNENKSSLSSNKAHNDDNSSNNKNSKSIKEEVINFTSYFDDYKGQVHLEALEMLSRQSTVKYELQMLNLNEKRVNSILEPIKKLFNVDELINNDDDNDDIDQNKEFDLTFFEDVFIDYMSELNIKLPIDNVIQSFKTASYTSNEITSINEFYNESVKCFALITATMVEFFHKIAESLLIQQQNNTSKKPNYMTLHKAENLCLITKLCVRSVTTIANDFCRNFKKLNQDKTVSNNQTITNIFLEASNGNTYISDAFVLLSPIFKCLLIDEANINF